MPDSALPTLPGFRLMRLLGAGAYGRVFLARETAGLGRTVALKLFPPESSTYPRELEWVKRVEELRRQARHPAIVQTLGTGEHEGQGWIALEYVEAGSLADRVQHDGPYSWERAVQAIREAASALEVLHLAGLFHRDVKPANLLVGSDRRVRLGDFGLARELDGTVSTAGSPAFSPPEVIANRVDPSQRARVDVYGLGATLAYLLTGEVARPGRPDAFALERCGTPRPVVEFVLCAMAYEPEERPADARAVGLALEKIQRELRTHSELDEEALQTKEDLVQKPEKSQQAVLPPERHDVHVGANRCPYCHEGVELESAWVSCRSCQARHHLACWDESSSCGSCGSRERSIRDPSFATPSLRVPLAAAWLGAGLCALGTQLQSVPGKPVLTQIKYCGAWGMLLILAGVWLAVRTSRLLSQAGTRVRLSRTVWLVLALPVLGLVATWSGLASLVDSMSTVPGYPTKDALAGGQVQAWLTTKLGCTIALPLLVLLGLGLVLKREPRLPT